MLQNFILNKKHMVYTLISISLILYAVDYFLLGSIKELSVWFLGNLAFLPVYVIIVTILIEQVIKERERQAVLRKLNMVIGVFFSEIGNKLLKELAVCVCSNTELKKCMLVNPNWKEHDFYAAMTYLNSCEIKIEFSRGRIDYLKDLLVSKRGFLISLLENQNLLEHEEFTDLLWAVFHLVEELEARSELSGLPQNDVDHLNGDIKRVFGYLSREWVSYIKHLKYDYPYLFSLAVRLNPMIDDPDAIIH